MGEKDLKKNTEYVEKNRDRLLNDYRNKYLLICDEKIINSFDTYAKAAEDGVQQFGIDTNFLVYHLTEKVPINFIMESIL